MSSNESRRGKHPHGRPRHPPRNACREGDAFNRVRSTARASKFIWLLTDVKGRRRFSSPTSVVMSPFEEQSTASWRLQRGLVAESFRSTFGTGATCAAGPVPAVCALHQLAAATARSPFNRAALRGREVRRFDLFFRRISLTPSFGTNRPASMRMVSASVSAPASA